MSFRRFGMSRRGGRRELRSRDVVWGVTGRIDTKDASGARTGTRERVSGQARGGAEAKYARTEAGGFRNQAQGRSRTQAGTPGTRQARPGAERRAAKHGPGEAEDMVRSQPVEPLSGESSGRASGKYNRQTVFGLGSESVRKAGVMRRTESDCRTAVESGSD